jgi:hypothetical protein
MEWQFACTAYQARSTQLLDQQCINAFVEPTPKEGKTQSPVFGIPGLSLFARMGNGPILGMHVMANNLYVLSGLELWEITLAALQATSAGSPVPATLIGATTLGNLASMADNAMQLVMVDGAVGWIYQPGGLNQVTTETVYAGATSVPANIIGTITAGDTLNIYTDYGPFTTTASATVGPFDTAIPLTDALPSQMTAGGIIQDFAVVLAQITAPAFMASATVGYFDGYFVFSAVGTRQFFLSAINDGTQYSGLDFATTTAGSDDLIGVVVYHEQLLLMCRLHTEIWWNSGAAIFPFQRYDAAEMARGLAAPLATASEDNTMFWLADDGIFYRFNNFLPQRISTFAMEHAWAQYPLRYLDASAFVIDQEGHKFVIVNFPSGEATWCYDIGASAAMGIPLWHQRESWGTPWV